MKKYISSFIIFSAIALIALSFKTESSKIGPHLKYVLENTNRNDFIVYVYLRDKGPNALSELSNPLNLITQRSINRRLKVKSPDKVVGFTDIPIYRGYINEISPNVLKVRNRLKWLNAVSVELNREQLNLISSRDFVKKIELVESYKRAPEPESDYAPLPQNNDNIDTDTLDYGPSFTQINQIKVNLVHNQGIFGQGILLASLDDGFRNQTHPCFTNPANPIQIVSQYDFQLHLPGAYRTDDGHGTTTISCIGAYAPGSLIGTAFKCKFLVARTEVDSFERNVEMDNWIAAAEWADSLGADVITSSLSYLQFDSGQMSYTWQDMDGNTLPVTIGADIAADNGITVFNSAGNAGSSSHNTLGGPADGDSVITVGAVNSSGVRTSFSSIGPTTDNPPRIKPDIMAMGSGVRTANGNGTGYSSFSSGTSYSCPLAAGVGALILSANKSLTPMQVRGILRKFSSQSNSPDNYMGWGIIDAMQSVDSARKLDNEPPVISHTQPFTFTTSTSTVTMKAKITDNGIIRLWTNQAPLLYYRKSTDNGNTWSSYASVNYNYYNNADSFFFPIPGSPAGTRVEYYFAAQDIALPTPKLATLPAGGGGINPPGSIIAPPTRFSYDVVLSGITGNTNEIPAEFKLYNNYPNPFNPSTKIKFDIAQVTNAKLIVYDVLGREITRIFDGNLKAGSYSLDFDASNLPSGVYFYRLITNSFTDTKKMLLIK